MEVDGKMGMGEEVICPGTTYAEEEVQHSMGLASARWRGDDTTRTERAGRQKAMIDRGGNGRVDES